MKQVILIFALLFTASLSYSTIINVPAQYTTIQGAVNASVNGDTILVAPGTYTENVKFRGKNIVLTSQFYMTNNLATIYATVIDGSNSSNPDSASCVMIIDDEDSTAVLQGFAITGGKGTKWNDEHFAGVYREGGGILVAYASPIIKNNIIYNNTCTDLTGVTSTGGGGVRIGDSYVRFYNNVVMNNTARYGAGIVLNYTGGEYKNNVICSNYGSSQFGAGAGIWLNNVNSRPCIIINNTITGNSSTAGFCGISGGSFAQLRNNIIWGNTSPTNTQASGTLNITYSCVQGATVFPGAGNTNLNPMFADTNFVLSSGSPCIDKGDSSVIYNDLPDTSNPLNARYPSMGGLRNDKGAYGGPLASLLSSRLIGIPGIGSQLPENFALYQNYPNPFNPSTNITFDLQLGDFVTLKVYDVLGKEVMMLVNDHKPAGRHSIRFNANTLSSGIYFYKLFYNGGSITNKMILSK
jgi:hypothetical protein